ALLCRPHQLDRPRHQGCEGYPAASRESRPARSEIRGKDGEALLGRRSLRPCKHPGGPGRGVCQRLRPGTGCIGKRSYELASGVREGGDVQDHREARICYSYL
ncbi:MAG: hypothetical protein AVDCRST_MAG37-1768, partial [uncultured Rubrobacteraceae bacterium]